MDIGQGARWLAMTIDGCLLDEHTTSCKGPSASFFAPSDRRSQISQAVPFAIITHQYVSGLWLWVSVLGNSFQEKDCLL